MTHDEVRKAFIHYMINDQRKTGMSCFVVKILTVVNTALLLYLITNL